MFNKIIKFFLENKLITILILVVFILLGIVYAPFNWNLGFFPRNPVPVDAIPDIGENQQIVYTEWPGRSPQDIEDQVSYPLTTALLGIPGKKLSAAIPFSAYQVFTSLSMMTLNSTGVGHESWKS